MLSTFPWIFLTILGIVFAVAYGYRYYKDRDKRKLMFTFAFIIASFGYLPQIQAVGEFVQPFQGVFNWSVLPLMLAVSIAVYDMNRNIVECNQAALDTFGVPKKDEILGKSGFGFVAKKDRQRVIHILKNVLEIGAVSNIEYIALDRDGYEFPAEFSASTIRDSLGDPIGFVVIVSDITERKKTEEALRKERETLERVTKNVGAGLGIISKDYHVLWANKVLNDVHPNVEGKLCYEIFSKRDSICPGCGVKEIFEKGKNQVIHEQVVPGFDGKDLWLEINATPIRDENGNITAALELIVPINERKRMENELRRYSEHLEELVEERTRALKKSQKRFVKTERLVAIGQAATMVGHDLRNPLQAIENGIFYLNTELTKLPVSQKITETLQAIHRSIDYADNIVKDLQTFASKRDPSFRETDINLLLENTLSYIETPENIETIIESDQLPKIEADKDMIKRVFVNLAVNGIQAMKEKGGTLKVSTKKTDGFIEVSFQDKGIGIKNENFRKLFTPFFTTKAQGMGVGLAICKRFAELHNGSIKVESEENEGSSFTVKLPIQRNGGEKT